MAFRSEKEPVFGVELKEVVSRTGKGTSVPSVVAQCIRFIESKGLNTEGIFRTPANATELHSLRKAFDANPFHELGAAESPHVVAGLLKLFFRELPEPLLTYELYHDWIDAVRSGEFFEKIRRIQQVVSKLPPLNRQLLDVLVVFLRRVQSHSNVNKMTAHNLAVVIGPNIFYPREVGLQMEHSQQIRELVQHLIADYDSVFSEHAPSPSPHVTVTSPSERNGSAKPSRLTLSVDRPVTPTTPTTPRLNARQQSKLNALLEQTTASFFDFSLALTETLEFVKSSTSHVRLVQDQGQRLQSEFGPVTRVTPSPHVQDYRTTTTGSPQADQSHISIHTSGARQDGGDEPAMEPGHVLARFELFLGRLPELRELMSKQRTSHNPLLPPSSTPPGSLKWLKQSEQVDVHAEYTFLHQALARWEADWVRKNGHGPMVRDKQINGVYSLYTSLQALHMVLSTTSDTQIEAVYSGPFSRAHYAHVKQERHRDDDQDDASPLSRALMRLEMDRDANGRPAEVVVMTLEQMRSEKHAVKKELKGFDADFMREHGRECSKQEKEPMRPLYKRYKELKDLIDAREKAEIRRRPAAPQSQDPPQASPKEGPQSARGVRKSGVKSDPRPQSSPGGRPGAKNFERGSQQGRGGDVGELSVTGVSASRGGDGPNSLAALKNEKRSLQAKLQRYQQEFIKQHGRKVKYRADRLPVEAEYDRYKKVKAMIADLENAA